MLQDFTLLTASSWKSQAALNLDQLKTAVQYLLRQNNLPDLAKFSDVALPSTTIASTVSSTEVIDETPSVQDDSDLVPPPMSNLYSLTENHHPHAVATARELDFIDRGIISLFESQDLFNHYRDHINPLLWGGALCSHQTLAESRQSSPLLTAAVLAVAALHRPEKRSVQTTYDIFVAVIKSSCLARGQNLDDIRGLCVGAFYMTNMSWRIVSRAVRIATEMNLHWRGRTDSHERLRLWYVLYVCDHQFAIAYGRPPLMHDDVAIRNVDKFLSSHQATNGDMRLIAQVNVFRILAEAYFLYGCEPDQELNESDFEKLRLLNVQIDQWRVQFQSKHIDMPTYGSFPLKGHVLYYHFARFHLNSMSLRGIKFHDTLSWDRREAANTAISAATSTLKLIIEEPDLNKALLGLPIFTHTMIAMCASFILKMAIAFGTRTQDGMTILVSKDLSDLGLTFYTIEAIKLVQDFTNVLASVGEHVSQRHLARHIVTGLKELLQRFRTEADHLLFSRINSVRAESGANSGLLPSRPVSRNEHRPNTAEAKPPTLDVGFLENTITFDGFDSDPLSMSIAGNFDWGFDDNFLWQTEYQDFQF